MCLVVLSHCAHLAKGMLGPSTPETFFEPFGLQRASMFALLALALSCLLLFIFMSGFMAYRLSASAKSSLQIAKQLLQKYLLWAIGGYAVLALVQRSIDWQAVGWGVVAGGPLAAYWYLTLAIVLYAMVPVLGPLVKKTPRMALALAVAIQVACFAEFYAGYEAPPRSLTYLLLRVVHFLPAFLFGMLASHYAETLSAVLHRHRRALRGALVVAGVLCLAEAYALGQASGFDHTEAGRWTAAERGSTVLFSLALLAVFMVWKFGSGSFSRWLGKVGLSSLGIMLMMDIFTKFTLAAVWHIPSIVLTGSWSGLNGELPFAVRAAAPAFVLVFFAAGVLGPLFVMKHARRFLGERVRYLW